MRARIARVLRRIANRIDPPTWTTREYSLPEQMNLSTAALRRYTDTELRRAAAWYNQGGAIGRPR